MDGCTERKAAGPAMSALFCLLSQETSLNLSSLQEPFRCQCQNWEEVSSAGQDLVSAGPMAPSLPASMTSWALGQGEEGKVIVILLACFFLTGKIPKLHTFIPPRRAPVNGVLGLEMDQGNCVQTYWKGHGSCYRFQNHLYQTLAKSKNAAVFSKRQTEASKLRVVKHVPG